MIPVKQEESFSCFRLRAAVDGIWAHRNSWNSFYKLSWSLKKQIKTISGNRYGFKLFYSFKKRNLAFMKIGFVI